ncbi:MAG: UTP--glucose-1-phosphate uridylyltransferase, partial [Candidatus Aminicenantes bacterium]|nr:UTP--glucose-1-phosphate uridylyltransferase [Candidatus Aminicenantes bacterium]
MRVRKAIIPAAGFGTRFLPATKAQPKEMIAVIDKPLIQYTVEEAAGAGIREIAVITSRGKAALEDHFDRSPELEAFLKAKGKLDLLEEVRRISDLARLTFIRQPEMLGLGHAILMGEEFAAGEPVAALTPDDIYDCVIPCTKQLVDVFVERKATVIVLGRVDEEGTK